MNESRFINKDEIKQKLLIGTYSAIIAQRATSHNSAGSFGSTDSRIRLLIDEALESIEKQLEKK